VQERQFRGGGGGQYITGQDAHNTGKPPTASRSPGARNADPSSTVGLVGRVIKPAHSASVRYSGPGCTSLTTYGT
jgi:hypothetical protein